MSVSDNIIKDAAKAVSHKSYEYQLLHNFIEHIPLAPPMVACATKDDDNKFETRLTRGDLYYYHYGCDGYYDNGWGCAYRTLQSMASWILHKRQWQSVLHVPSINEIQQTLVNIEDKPCRFVGSRDWIGALEVFYTIDALYDVSCKILHVTKQEDLQTHTETLMKYFKDFGGFVMMGGDVDAASKGIAGVHSNGKDTYLLVVDPHYTGVPASIDALINDGYLRWQHTKEFVDSSFYNLCLPYLK